MPGLNRTGPLGEGPRTGRGLGLCNPRSGDLATRFAWGAGRGHGFGRGRGFGRGFGPGMGWGRGYGRGFGWRRFGASWSTGYAPAYTPETLESGEEVEILRSEADSLKKALDQINKRIDKLERKSSE
jgi:hypothetical protein